MSSQSCSRLIFERNAPIHMTTMQQPGDAPATEGDGSPYAHAKAPSDDGPTYNTLTYEVDGRVARLTFNRPDQGNSITPTPRSSSPTPSNALTSTRACTSSC